MPQLNPNPWFLIFIMSWLVYLILMHKINNFNMMNKPTVQDINKNKPQPWNWLWT